MTIFTESHARLADDAYKDGTLLRGTPFTILRTIDKPAGYHGVIYRNEITHEIVVAHRGTEFEKDMLRDLGTADVQMALLKVNEQVHGAREAVELALALAKLGGPNGERVTVTVTGHSLGGSLAQITAAEYSLRGETFNAYGTAGFYDTPAGGDLVVNHVRATDMVSAAGKHFGSVRVYATQFDEQIIYREAGRSAEIPFPHGLVPLNPIETHDMRQFYGENSIIRPESVQRYEQNKAIYDEYRQDIRETALTVRYGMPLATAIPGIGTPILSLYAYEAASYVSHGIGRSFSHNKERASLDDDGHWGHKLQSPPAQPSHGPPLQPCRNQSGWDYDQSLQQMGDPYRNPALQPPPPGASTRELFEHMYAAMETGDDKVFKQAIATVADSPSNREFWAHISASVDADEREAVLQTQVREQAVQLERQGPSMSRGFSR